MKRCKDCNDCKWHVPLPGLLWSFFCKMERDIMTPPEEECEHYYRKRWKFWRDK